MNYYPYTCKETCGQEKHCGNRYCSAHPQYLGPKTKKSKDLKKSHDERPSYSRNRKSFQSHRKYQ